MKGFHLFGLIASAFLAAPAFAIDEDIIATLVPEDWAAQHKATLCEKSATMTSCSYVWGPPSDKDEMRTKMGLPPEGNILSVIVAQASGPQDFDRVLEIYTDAEPVEGMGVNAVWSPLRSQLSFITEGNMIIHVYLEDNLPNPQERAARIGQQVVEMLG